MEAKDRPEYKKYCEEISNVLKEKGVLRWEVCFEEYGQTYSHPVTVLTLRNYYRDIFDAPKRGMVGVIDYTMSVLKKRYRKANTITITGAKREGS